MFALNFAQSTNIDAKITLVDGKELSSKIRFRTSIFYENEIYENSITQKYVVLINEKGKKEKLLFKREGNVAMVTMPASLKSGMEGLVTVYYQGVPRAAVRAPWDGGISWSKDELGNPFVATSCQGLGASVWWPCKDHQYDEPEQGVTIGVRVPDTLMNISNGKIN